MTEINIEPIFNRPSPEIWRDILDIGTAAILSDYGTGHLQNYTLWQDSLPNIMFGAFDGNKLVGFAVGIKESGTICLDGMYVLPKYQHFHIGSRMLRAFEHAGALLAKNAELTALPRAEKFYRRYGWSVLYSNVYTKKINVSCEIVPVFRPTPNIKKAYKLMSGGVDLSRDYTPGDALFVRVNDMSKIVGIGIGRPDRTTQQFRVAKIVVASGIAPGVTESIISRVITKLPVRG